MDSYLIKEFRNRVNKHDLILHIYRNYNGKNKWNIICSAMDWIQVGVSGIDINTLQRTNSDQASVKVITYIATIDVMWEGIQLLHRVLFDTDSIPFVGRNDIFHKDIDDNRYWKEIRAAFATHPSNLNRATEKEKRFASWSGGGFAKSGDFSVILYSSDPSKEDEFFDIQFDEIQAFAASRYEYLHELAIRIDQIEEQWCDKWKKRSIVVTGNTLDDIDTLLKANEERLEYDYYNWRLQEIKAVFTVKAHGEKNSKLLDEYRQSLVTELESIRQALQKMDLEYEPDFTDYVNLEYNYQNQQIFEEKDGLLNWSVECLKTPLGQYADLDNWETVKELQVLVRAAWWKVGQIHRG